MTCEIVEGHDNQCNLIIGKVTMSKPCEPNCDEYDEKYNGMRRDVRANRWVRLLEEAFRKLWEYRVVLRRYKRTNTTDAITFCIDVMIYCACHPQASLFF